MKTGVLRISDWARLWVQVGAKLRAILEASWAEVGANWSKLGRSWALAGRSWEVDPKSGQCAGWKRHIWTILDRSAKCANYYSPVHFLAARPSEHGPPPAEAVAV